MFRRRALALTAFTTALAAAVSAQAGIAVVEKDLNLDIARRVAAGLRAEAIVVRMTRTSDRTVWPDERMRKANGFGADIFVSIHNNVAGSSAQGTMIFHSLRHDGSSRLAAKIRGGFVEEFGAGRRATTHTRRGDHGDYYFQLRESDAPAVIVECAFVSNPAEGKRLATDPGFRQDIADAIVLGVVRYQRTLHPPAAPRLEPGTTFPAPLPPPAEGDARALGATRVRLSWAQSLLSRTYRVYRDDVLIAERTAATDERPRFTDRWAAPGQTYEYRIVPTTPAAGATGEGPPLTLRATTPPISVALDPGHGGVDPGAVRHY